jgi:hypothetical protein
LGEPPDNLTAPVVFCNHLFNLHGRKNFRVAIAPQLPAPAILPPLCHLTRPPTDGLSLLTPSRRSATDYPHLLSRWVSAGSKNFFGITLNAGSVIDFAFNVK